MFHLTIGKDSIELMQTADRLAQYVLEEMTDSGLHENPHKRAIMLVQTACQFLQATYQGEESLVNILYETARLIEDFSRPGGDA